MKHERAYRVGDIVRIPPGSIYGDLAMVRGDGAGGIRVGTERYHLAYEATDVTYIGRIALGRTYTGEGARWRDCFFVNAENRWVGTTVCIRPADAAEDFDDMTTQWHAFSALVADGIIT